MAVLPIFHVIRRLIECIVHCDFIVGAEQFIPAMMVVVVMVMMVMMLPIIRAAQNALVRLTFDQIDRASPPAVVAIRNVLVVGYGQCGVGDAAGEHAIDAMHFE